MFSAIKTLHQGVDVCINNAGLANAESLLSGRTEGWKTMIDVSGFQPFPTVHIYHSPHGTRPTHLCLAISQISTFPNELVFFNIQK